MLIMKKREDNSNFSESTIDNDHFLPNQPISLPTVLNELLFLLNNIFDTNIFLLLKIFKDLNEDFLESPTME